MPLSPPAVRGIGLRRERTVILVDARMCLGYPTRLSEVDGLTKLLEDREADHVRWVDALLHAISTETEFTLARDPHQCAFGRWYDNYVAPTLSLRQQFAKFAAPHEAVHALAQEAENLARTSGKKAAIDLIETFKVGSFGRMRQLFCDTRQLIRDEIREIAVTHYDGRQYCGLVVDSIEAVEVLRADTLEDLKGRMPRLNEQLVRWSARTSKDAIVMLLELNALSYEAALAA